MSKIKIFLFGASEAGLHALTHLSNKVQVIGFIDNDSKKIGTKYQGFPVLVHRTWKIWNMIHSYYKHVFNGNTLSAVEYRYS